jgi:hypothetical protein
MTRIGVPIGVAIVAGIAAVYLLPPPWLAPLSAVAAVCAMIFAIIVRLDTKREPPANPMAGVLLSIVNFPEQPLAKVKKGWALTTFLASAVFLVSLGLSVMVRASS